MASAGSQHPGCTHELPNTYTALQSAGEVRISRFGVRFPAPPRYGVVEGTDVVEGREVVELADVSGVVASCGVGSGDVGCSVGGSDDGSDDGCV